MRSPRTAFCAARPIRPSHEQIDSAAVPVAVFVLIQTAGVDEGFARVVRQAVRHANHKGITRAGIAVPVVGLRRGAGGEGGADRRRKDEFLA